MKNVLPIIIAVLVTAIASSSITYFVTVDKNGEKEEAEVNIEVDNNDDNGDFSSRILKGYDQVITGSSSENAVEIKSAELAKSKEGEDAVVITFVYSRLSGEPDSFYSEFYEDNYVFQNGVGLEEIYSHHFDTGENWGDKLAEVRAGYSNEFKMAFRLNDLESDILVECSSYSGYVISRAFELN